MSRIAKQPIAVPQDVEVLIDKNQISIKGNKGAFQHHFPKCVTVEKKEREVICAVNNEEKASWALAGTTRALLANMIIGVTHGFEKKLQLVGVGYRAQSEAKVLNLTLGFSHPVKYVIPDGIEIETPSPTEVIVKGVDKQKVGQAAAEIRRYRSPEPYKGKGVRYVNEHITLKETKKK